MILIDTSVWVDHLRAGDPILAQLLEADEALVHPFVVGELALGDLQQRERILGSLRKMPEAIVAADREVLHFIDSNDLAGRGIGYVDAHLLASARLTDGTRLWTRDRRLDAAAEALGLAARLAH